MNQKAWAEAVKERDGWTCQRCGVSPPEIEGRFIHAHHIKPRIIGGKNTLENGKTLCNSCHPKEHAEMDTKQWWEVNKKFSRLFFQRQLELVQRRVIKRMTLTYVAEQTGVPRHTVRRYAYGTIKRYNANHLASLCEFFNCQPADLINIESD